MEIISRKQFPTLVLFLFSCFTTLSAQNTNDKAKKQENGKGTVTVTQSAEIDALVNRGKLTTPAVQQDKKKTAENPQPTNTDQNTGNEPQSLPEDSIGEAQPQATHIVPDDDHIRLQENYDYSAPETVKGPKIMRGSRSVRGFRIQVYTGGNKGIDRKRAEEAGERLKRKYPSLPVYTHFYSPRWICQCGNFHKHKEAEEFLKKIKQIGFPKASIVRATIMVNDNPRTYQKSQQTLEQTEQNEEEQ